MNTVGELGESGVLRRVLAQLSDATAATVGPGDDCAVLGFGGNVVVTADTMIEGPDFRLAWHTGFELGWKLAATNLSDVAAMGARPVALTVAFACPADTPVALLETLASGLNAACGELAPGCGVVGGDLGRAPVLTIAVTALGDLDGRAAVLRSTASAGDAVVYAGDLGLAGLGLAHLFNECADADGVAHSDGLDALRAARPIEISAQLAPSPPIHLGIVASEAGATSMMDVSDGLALDAARIAGASEVAIDLDAALLTAAFGEQCGVQVPLDAMLYGGEDHGLLATFAADAALPEGFHRIGTVREHAADAPPLTLDGKPCEARGWDPYLAGTVKREG